ncbi:MAG: hypothetical protein QM809_10640 [Gordonia sp. (in: high G+C Gram-positive bacteria)]|uniref:hypothetical protein n=1 Tax=Gordonia sp. (in: high G+C Gram-positive bacteria) TaxID=84139 RepID=UPI0039E38CB6
MRDPDQFLAIGDTDPVITRVVPWTPNVRTPSIPQQPFDVHLPPLEHPTRLAVGLSPVHLNRTTEITAVGFEHCGEVGSDGAEPRLSDPGDLLSARTTGCPLIDRGINDDTSAAALPAASTQPSGMASNDVDNLHDLRFSRTIEPDLPEGSALMATDLETTYADLLDTLPTDTRRILLGSIGNAVLEGWEPTREDIELQVLDARGELSDEEFDRRARALAQQKSRHRSQTAS